MGKMEYTLLDSGAGEKLERFGDYTLIRPCFQAIWSKSKDKMNLWDNADASFNRKKGLNWQGRDHLPQNWTIQINSVKMKLSTTDFGHIGIFPETIQLWESIQSQIKVAHTKQKQPLKFLNLFAYSGGATMAAAHAGAHCCHVDASKGMVQWARDNAELNGLSDHPIRWIVDDVNKFLQREIRRGVRYDGILLDPPSFGRGKSGELYKIEHAMLETLDNVKRVLSDDFSFVYLTSHTPGFTPTVLSNLLNKMGKNGNIFSGEMLLSSIDTFESKVINKQSISNSKNKSKNHNETLNIPNGTWACLENR
jgi:23S rRNA (cytosine1962-C5)-methyltransferase